MGRVANPIHVILRDVILRNSLFRKELSRFRDFPKCRKVVHQKQSTAVYSLPHKNPHGVLTRESYIPSVILQREQLSLVRHPICSPEAACSVASA